MDGEVGVLGEVLTQQPIGVLVAATRPGRVCVGEEDDGAGGGRWVAPVCELTVGIRRLDLVHGRTGDRAVTRDSRLLPIHAESGVRHPLLTELQEITERLPGRI